MFLFEFGDLKEVPSFYHEFLRNFMGQLYKKLGHYKLWSDSFSEFCQNNKDKTIHDPCSGSGEINELLIRELPNAESYHFLLTDLMAEKTPEYHEYFKSIKDLNISFAKESYNLLTDTSHKNSPKVFINSFHHFTDSQVKEILENNLSQNNEILILEYCHKTIPSYLSMILGPLMALIMFPFVVNKKIILPCFIFTYLIPIIPLFLLWDGFVSCLRTYSKKDITKILKDLKIDKVEIEEKKKYSLLFPAGVTSIYLKKRPE